MNKMATFQPLKKMIFNKILVRHLTCSRKFSNKLRESTNEYEENFTNMIEKRRKEARKTISVEVNGEKDRESVEKACSEAGIVASMRHYTTQSNSLKPYEQNFYLVEFAEEEMVKEVMLHKAVLSETKFAIRSPFLTLEKGLRGHELNSNNRVEESRKRLKAELNNCTNISHQIEVYFNRIRASDTDIRLKYLTCRQIELPLSGIFPYFSLFPFGSSVNGFGNQSSDLDGVISLEGLQECRPISDLQFQNSNSTTYNRLEDRFSAIPYLKLITDILYMMPGISKVKCLPRARVPIIKYVNSYTGLDCDISGDNWSGFYMSEMLYNYTRVEPRLAPLVLCVRLWARHHSLTSDHPGRWITNFSLSMMVLHYMVARQGLVPLNVLQSKARKEDVRTMENGRDCTFLRDIHQVRKLQGPPGEASMEQLFRGFLDYYAAFDFQQLCLSPLTGRPLPNTANKPLHIENPLQPELNVSQNVTMEETNNLMSAFRSTRLVEQGEEEVWGVAKFLPPLGVGNGLCIDIRDLFPQPTKNSTVAI